MFTKLQVTNGLERAKNIYEGWKLEDLDADQLIEAIEQAEPPIGPEEADAIATTTAAVRQGHPDSIGE